MTKHVLSGGIVLQLVQIGVNCVSIFKQNLYLCPIPRPTSTTTRFDKSKKIFPTQVYYIIISHEFIMYTIFIYLIFMTLNKNYGWSSQHHLLNDISISLQLYQIPCSLSVCQIYSQVSYTRIGLFVSCSVKLITRGNTFSGIILFENDICSRFCLL